MTQSGLSAVFLENRPMLLRLLIARLGNREDAEDTLQDMWMRIDQLASQPIAQPAAFLYRVAANLATDRRIAVRRRDTRDAAWLDAQPLAEDLPDAERTLIARDRLAAIEGVIRAMPERMGIALRMFRIEGRSQRAIAAEIGISVSGVEKLLQRAYKQILDSAADLDAGIDDPCRLRGEGGSDRAE